MKMPARLKTSVSSDFLLTSGLALLDLAFLIAVIYPLSRLNPYMFRDIARTKELLAGHLIWVGPDTTQGGFTPGPFFYYLFAPFVFLSTRFDVILIMLMGARSCALVAFSSWLSAVIDCPVGILFAGLSSSIFLMMAFLWVNNSTFILILLPVLLWQLCKYLQAPEMSEKRNLAVLSLLIGCFAQIHLSFLIFIPMLIAVLVWKAASWRRACVQSLMAVGFIGTPMLPYCVAWWLSAGVHIPDGPVFHHLYSNLRAFHQFTTEKAASSIHIREVWTTLPWGNGELWVVYFIFMIRMAVWILKRRWSEKVTILDLLRMFTFVVMVGSSAYVFSSVAPYRYNYIWFFLAWLSLLLDLVFLTEGRRRLGLCLLIFILQRGYLLASVPSDGPVELANPVVTTQDAKQFCAYFNERKIAFEDFRRSAYQIVSFRNEPSFANIAYCFDKELAVDDGHPRHYLILGERVLSRHSLRGLLGQVPIEIRDLYSEDRLTLKLKTDRYRLYEVNDGGKEPNGTWRSNLTFAYELDPGLPLSRQLNRISKSSVFSSRGALVAVSEVRFCADPLFCSLYVFSQLNEGRPRLLFVSRAFQTIFMLSPFFGLLENVDLNFDCDQASRSVHVASRLGIVDNWTQNTTFFTPLFLQTGEVCKQIKLISIHVGKETLAIHPMAVQTASDRTYFFKNVDLR